MSPLRALRRLEHRLKLVTPRLLRKKPLFLARAAWRMATQRYMKEPPLRGVLFATHYACNLNCRHCYEKHFHQTDAAPLSLAEKKRIIAECLDAGVLAFDFIGGETSLSSEFPELVRACKPHRTYIALASNGYALDEDQVRRFLDLGVDKISISIDGMDEAAHDDFRRRPGSHRRALESLALCRKVGMDAHIGMVVSRGFTQTESFRKMVDFALEQDIRLGLIPAVPLGNWQGNRDVLISAEDRRAMDELHAAHPTITSDNYGNRRGGCPAFDEVITITAYGDVLPCDFIHISFGNLREESLADVLRRGRSVRYFDGRYQGCLAAECREFQENRLSRTYGAEPYPVRAETVFEELGAPAEPAARACSGACPGEGR